MGVARSFTIVWSDRWSDKSLRSSNGWRRMRWKSVPRQMRQMRQMRRKSVPSWLRILRNIDMTEGSALDEYAAHTLGFWVLEGVP